jgi:hypothetical protein
MNENCKTPVIDPNEFSAMETDAERQQMKTPDETQRYTHKFKKPYKYGGKTYTELTFEWDSLTGKDGLDIEADLAARGVTVVAPEFSSAYQAMMACRACTVSIDYEAFAQMPLSTFNQIKRHARTFLLISK